MRRNIVCALALVCAASGVSAQDREAESLGRINVKVRDSVTGLGVPAELQVFHAPGEGPVILNKRGLAERLGDAPEPVRVLALGHAGARGLALEPATYVFTAAAPGYRALNSYFTLTPGQSIDAVFALDPVAVPARLAPKTVLAQHKAGHAFFHGHVVDDESGLPVHDARVLLPKTSVDATTDADGYFRLHAPQPWVPDADELPAADDLVVEAPGYKTHVRRGEMLSQGDRHFIVSLQRGEGQVELDARHKLQLTRVEAQAAQARGGEEAGAGGEAPAPPEADLTVVDPPDSIRVGYTSSGATCCSSCSLVYTFSTETYVKRGLNDEWIASWGTHSLRSGAVPYRSYGVYHVYNPKASTYDICSNACCQVNDSDTSTSTNTAGDRTAGIVLYRSGAIFRAEYSAENNCWDDPNDGLSCVNTDRSCGNCYVGSPAASWPCLYDSVACNRGCFGHGRGESQWGTYRWELNNAQKWKWIVDHYYNANGAGSGLRTAYLTTPIRINSVTASPTSVNDGTSFTITMNLTSFAGVSHTQIMLGASLYSSATGYIDNTANDKKVTVVNGTANVTRTFTVPVGTGARAYDLVTAVWLDVDEDGLIESSDLPLTSNTRVGYISVF